MNYLCYRHIHHRSQIVGCYKFGQFQYAFRAAFGGGLLLLTLRHGFAFVFTIVGGFFVAAFIFGQARQRFLYLQSDIFLADVRHMYRAFIFLIAHTARHFIYIDTFVFADAFTFFARSGLVGQSNFADSVRAVELRNIRTEYLFFFGRSRWRRRLGRWFFDAVFTFGIFRFFGRARSIVDGVQINFAHHLQVIFKFHLTIGKHLVGLRFTTRFSRCLDRLFLLGLRCRFRCFYRCDRFLFGFDGRFANGIQIDCRHRLQVREFNADNNLFDRFGFFRFILFDFFFLALFFDTLLHQPVRFLFDHFVGTEFAQQHLFLLARQFCIGIVIIEIAALAIQKLDRPRQSDIQFYNNLS